MSNVIASTLGTFSKLPPELRLHVTELLDEAGEHDTLARLGQTSRDWRALVGDRPALHVDMFLPTLGGQLPPQAMEQCRARLLNLIDKKSAALLSRFLTDLALHSPRCLAVINETTAQSLTPLMCAARIGAFGVCKVLVSRGARAHVRDSLGLNAARWAAMGNYQMCAVWLFSAAQLHEATAGASAISLGEAVSAGHVHMARQLLPNDDQALDIELLYRAVKSKNPVALTHLLLDHDSRLKSRGLGPSLHAIANHDDPLPCIQPLIPHVDTNHLLLGAAKTNKLATLEHLLALSGIDINFRNTEGRTPLYWAAFIGKAKAIDALVKAGADHTIEAHDGTSALSIAMSKVARIVTEYDDDPYDGASYTVLNESSEHEAIVTRLLALTWSVAAGRKALEALNAVREDMSSFNSTRTTRVYSVLDGFEEKLFAKHPTLRASSSTPVKKENKKLWRRLRP